MMKNILVNTFEMGHIIMYKWDVFILSFSKIVKNTYLLVLRMITRLKLSKQGF